MKFSLDREWKFSKGEYDVKPEGLAHNNVYNFSKTGGAVGVSADTWEDVDLPHDWQHNQPFELDASPNHGYRKGEIGWYRRKFCLEETDRQKALRIEFDGISGITDIIYVYKACK